MVNDSKQTAFSQTAHSGYFCELIGTVRERKSIFPQVKMILGTFQGRPHAQV